MLSPYLQKPLNCHNYVSEVEDLQKFLSPSKLVQYKPNLEIKNQLKDGGVAIVDQIICSYAR